MKIAIVGSRDFTDYERFLDLLFTLNSPISEVISGGARGTDSLARRFANEFNLPIKEFLPDWSRTRGAGMIRNQEIISHADAVIVFWDGKSKGTQHSLTLARKANKLLHLFLLT